MLKNLPVEIDKRSAELYILANNLKPIFIPLIISIFFLLAQYSGSFDGININFAMFNKYIAVIFIAAIGIYIFSLIQAKTLKYEIRESVLYMEFGVFFHTISSVPLTKITDVEIYSGILEKFLCMEVMKIQTAGRGSNNPEIIIIAPSTPKDTAEVLLVNRAVVTAAA